VFSRFQSSLNNGKLFVLFNQLTVLLSILQYLYYLTTMETVNGENCESNEDCKNDGTMRVTRVTQG
jgi:hypothetical protein